MTRCIACGGEDFWQDVDYAVIDFSMANSCSCPLPDLDMIARASCRLVGSGETDARVLFIAPDGEHRSRFLRLEADGRVEICGTDAQARARLQVLRTAQ